MPTITIEVSDQDMSQIDLRMSQQLDGPTTPEAFVAAFLNQKLHDPEPTMADLGFGQIDRDTAQDTNLVVRGLDDKLGAMAKRVDSVAEAVDRIETKVKVLASIPTPPMVPAVNGAGQPAPSAVGPNFRLHQSTPAPTAAQPTPPAPIHTSPVTGPAKAGNDAYRAWRGRIRL